MFDFQRRFGGVLEREIPFILGNFPRTCRDKVQTNKVQSFDDVRLWSGATPISSRIGQNCAVGFACNHQPKHLQTAKTLQPLKFSFTHCRIVSAVSPDCDMAISKSSSLKQDFCEIPVRNQLLPEYPGGLLNHIWLATSNSNLFKQQFLSNEVLANYSSKYSSGQKLCLNRAKLYLWRTSRNRTRLFVKFPWA